MPQALDEQRALLAKWFGGDGIDDGPPYAFLRARGWTERGGLLIKPTSAHTVSEYEWQCVAFLCDEWDYGYDPKVTA